MAKDELSGFSEKTITAINSAGYLGDTQVVDRLVAQFVAEITRDMETRDPTETDDAAIERHLAICQRYADIWAGKNPDYQTQSFCNSPAYLRYLKAGANIKADNTEDAVYCLFGMLLRTFYGLVKNLNAGTMTEDDTKWQMEGAVSFTATALLGLDLSDFIAGG